MRRVFCIVGSAFLISSFIASLISLKWQIIILIICLISFVSALFLKNQARKYFAAIAAFACLGILLFTVKDACVYAEITKLDGITTNCSGMVTQRSITDDGDYIYELRVSQIGNYFYSDRKLNITLYATKNLAVGLYENVNLSEVRFYIPTKSDMFDGVRYNKSKNIYICGSYYPFDENVSATITPSPYYPIAFYITSLNEKLCRLLDQKLPPETASFVKGIILGDKRDIEFSLSESYKDAGVAHIFSISGMHISILAGVLLLLLKPVHKRIKIPIILGVTLTYILLSGAQISAIRSGFMIAVMLLAQLFYRESDSANSLFFAVFVIVLFNPFAIMDLGLLMSFLATFGVVVLAPILQKSVCSRLPLTTELSVNIVSLLCMSLCAEAMLLPVFILSFHTISIISPITNLITAVTISPIMILAFLSVILIQSPLLPIILFLESPLISVQNKVVSALGALPFAIVGVDFAAFSAWLIICTVIISITIIWYKFYPERSLANGSAALCGLLFVVCMLVATKDKLSDFSVYLVGDNTVTNIVMLHKGTATVISSADDDYIDIQTLHFLKGKGIRRIDNLILTYTEFSQFNDTISLVSAFPVKDIYYNKSDPNFENAINSYIKSPNLQSNMYEIKDGLSLTISDNTDIGFDYLKTNLTLSISHNENLFLLCDYSFAVKHIDYDMAFIRGQLPDNADIIPKNAVLLENNYNHQKENSFLNSLNSITRISKNDKKNLVLQHNG